MQICFGDKKNAISTKKVKDDLVLFSNGLNFQWNRGL